MKPGCMFLFQWLFLQAVLACFSVVHAEPVVTSRQSDCLPLADDPAGQEDKVIVEVRGCDLRLLHENVVTNCCLEYAVKSSVEGSTVELWEVDNGPPCDCICPFDLEATVAGLEPGRYSVIVHAFLHGDPLTYEAVIPPCDGFWIMAPEVWSQMGIEGVVVPVFATNEKPLEGFSFGTAFPAQHAHMAEINLRETITEQVGAEFLNVQIENGGADPGPSVEGWATCAVILDTEPPFEGQTIPAGAGQKIANLVYDILPPGGSVPRSISVRLLDGVGKPPILLTFVVGGDDVVPEVQNGIIQLTWPPEFLRGDANDNSRIGIADAIWLLNWLFRSGPIPPCEDAADTNDDGELDISDAVLILAYLFMGKEIPPPSPAGPPAPDPTLDALGCERNR